MEKPIGVCKSNIYDDLPFLFGVISRKMTHLLMQRLKDYEITTDQWLVLYKVQEQEGMSEKEVAERTNKDKSTTTRIIDALVAKAFVVKKCNKSDRRSWLMYVTEKGKALIEQTKWIERKTHDDVVLGIRSTEYELLIRLLYRMRENIDRMKE